jgi:co-chaperonin GroES (HSP10)
MYEKSAHGVALSKLPRPAGYKILIYVPDVQKKTSGGIILPEEHLAREKTASVVGQVVALGPSAYLDPDKFPAGPYCKEGDWIMIHSYSGSRFKIDGKDFRLINDDTIEALTEDPGSVERA